MMRMTSSPAICAGVLGRLALVVVEVRGDGDDRLGDRLAEVVLRDDLHLLKDHRADLGDRVLLVAELDAHVAVRPFDDAVARRQRPRSSPAASSTFGR